LQKVDHKREPPGSCDFATPRLAGLASLSEDFQILRNGHEHARVQLRLARTKKRVPPLSFPICRQLENNTNSTRQMRFPID
jgi:hypothetical protein